MTQKLRVLTLKMQSLVIEILICITKIITLSKMEKEILKVTFCQGVLGNESVPTTHKTVSELHLKLLHLYKL